MASLLAGSAGECFLSLLKVASRGFGPQSRDRHGIPEPVFLPRDGVSRDRKRSLAPSCAC
jgi:hypothetical protein